MITKEQIRLSLTQKDWVSELLINRYGLDIAPTLKDYQIGQSKHSEKASIFFHTDIFGNTQDGVIFGKDRKKVFLSVQKMLPKSDVAFGEHLIPTQKNVVFVSTYIAALICAYKFPYAAFCVGSQNPKILEGKNVFSIPDVGVHNFNSVDLRYLAGGLDLPFGTTLENFLLNGEELFLDDFLVDIPKDYKRINADPAEKNNTELIKDFHAQKKKEKIDKFFSDYPILNSFVNKFDLKETDFFFKKTPQETFLEELELDSLLKNVI